MASKRSMDDAKRTVLVAALSAYADLLAKNTAQLELEQGKGKEKASDDDIDLTAEIKNEIKLCGELANSITSAPSGKDLIETFEPAVTTVKSKKNEHESWDRLKNVFDTNPTAKQQSGWEQFLDSCEELYPSSPVPQGQTKSGISKVQPSNFVDNTPYFNPFTGLAVIPETGSEAGPSNRAPALLQNPPLVCPPITVPTWTPSMPVLPTRASPSLSRASSHPSSLRVEASSKPPVRPPPKPTHLRALPLLPDYLQQTSKPLPPERSAPPPPTQFTPPPERPPPPPPPPPSYRNLELPQSQKESKTLPISMECGLSRMTSVTRKPVATGQRANKSLSQSGRTPRNVFSTSLIEQPSTLSLSTYWWECDIQDPREEFPRDVGQISSTAHKRGYMRHVAELASKALKAAGSMISPTRTLSASLPQSPDSQEMGVMTPEPPSEPAASTIGPRNSSSLISTTEVVGGVRRRPSQETLPPAYDTLFHISRRSSAASDLSATRSSIWTPSAAFSSRTSLSSVIVPTNPWTSYPSTASSAGSSYSLNLPKRSRRTMSLPSDPSPQRTVMSPLSPNIAPSVNRSNTGTPSRRTRYPSMTPFFTKQEADNPVSNQPLLSFSLSVDQIAADAALAKSLDVEEQSNTSPLASPSVNNTVNQRNGDIQRYQYVDIRPQRAFNTNNPWKDHISADEAFARALQQKEYRDIQLERDLLLAHSVANGTAVDEDLELAYFMSQETAILIASTEADGQHMPGVLTHPDMDARGIDRETLQMQSDWLEARELEKKLRAQDAAEDLSLSEAKKLQAAFDQETKNEEAWEDWKKSNIEECVVCGDEQHREELARPCEHGYCDECLQAGFKNALTTKTPLKCCKKALSIGDCPNLPPEFVAEYEEMMLELSTPNPMYCSNAQCAKFLPIRVIVGDNGTCERCKTQTCKHCRQQEHPGKFCAEDKETEAVKNLAKKKGWKTCPGCNHLIERQSGCLHMICSRCQTAFCYRCSKPWRDCESTCPDAVSALHPKNY